ncbi:hypothetical protein [Vibrio maerlii]|uniref:hypothetical protein n=1 Tax=Vibrio maerlii TaxID=2231648 RepID=UPI000E3B9704|nr:hypothetical protein [Vibrio maerlii]
MELKRDPKCYTDVCIDGKWFHYDHCSTHAYMLRGGASVEMKLERVPITESELIDLLSDART